MDNKPFKYPEGAWLFAECEMIFIQLLQLSF